MSEWKAIKKEEIDKILLNARFLLEGIPKDFWRLIKLKEPEKWVQNPYGDEGGGFWVVAVFGYRCIYFNDIEEGFNISSFKEWGKIDEYNCEQTELVHLIKEIVSARFKLV